MRLSVDVGGTFIDFVGLDEATGAVRTEKVRATGDLSQRLLEGVKALGIDLPSLGVIVHGSTMVINSIVQEKGAKVGLITTKGFRDVLELGRGNRAEIYNLFYKQPPPIVARYLRLEASERIDSRGGVVEPLAEDELRDRFRDLVAQGVESVAICFLNAYANPAHERAAARIFSEMYPDLTVSISSDIVQERREYERTSTTVLNSFTQPKLGQYLDRLSGRLKDEGFTGVLSVMQSTGGVTSKEIAKAIPIRAVQSGPAGGVIGALRLSEVLGEKNFVVADLGGTTFDVSLIQNGKYFERSDVVINRRPIMQPTIDIVSIGAGGGSIVAVDDEGGLSVGPHSAQADPGPVCYGFGGTQVTLTDALLVLGYFDPQTYMAGRFELDIPAAKVALEQQVGAPLNLSLEQAAAGIMRLTTMNMAHAIRQITIERGFDPREFSMLCIGGGSGLFAGGLLDELDFKSVTVPLNPAVFSAWGLLNADYREDLSRSFICVLEEGKLATIRDSFAEMEVQARKTLASMRIEKARVERFFEMRYLGQAHTVRVAVSEENLSGVAGLAALREQFDAVYKRAYSHVLPGVPLEITTLRLAAIGETEKPGVLRGKRGSGAVRGSSQARKVTFGADAKAVDFAVHDRGQLQPGDLVIGPAIIEEWNCTVVVNPGQRSTVDDFGNLIVEKVR